MKEVAGGALIYGSSLQGAIANVSVSEEAFVFVILFKCFDLVITTITIIVAYMVVPPPTIDYLFINFHR